MRVEMKKLFFECHYGLGDNFYERPFIMAASDGADVVYVKTHFPELYHNAPPGKFIFVQPDHMPALRLQTQNAAKFRDYDEEPRGLRKFSLRSPSLDRTHQMAGLSRFESYALRTRCSEIPNVESLVRFPLKPEWQAAAEVFMRKNGLKPGCFSVFRPPTVQRGVSLPGRYADLRLYEYLFRFASSELPVVGVANQADGFEQILGRYQYSVDATSGQLDIWTVIALMEQSAFNFSGPGNFIPISLSLAVPQFTLFPAAGCEDPHWQIPAYWGAFSRIGYVRHGDFCSEAILALEMQFFTWFNNINN